MSRHKRYDYPAGVKAIYDKPSFADRYTVAYDPPFMNHRGERVYQCLGMNERPFHPQGIGQHADCPIGSHLGKKIMFRDLPSDCKKAVMQDLSW